MPYMTEEEWQGAERRDPARTYIDVPAFDRHTRSALTCFVLMVLGVAILIWWGHTDISTVMAARDQAIQAEWNRLASWFCPTCAEEVR
jgi:hypothetical protein